jgi:rhamnulokinase
MNGHDRPALVALDLGAQSCRVSLLRWRGDVPSIELMYRMPNAPVSRGNELRWDLAALTAGADEGLRQCAALAPEGIAAIGVTGWAVDYVRLATGKTTPIADPFCYRDTRNMAAMEQVHARIAPERLYTITGIQPLAFNTIYQLHADAIAGLPASLRWLNLPEYMLYRWGASPAAEYTNATHTGLVDLHTRQWSPEIFAAAGLDLAAAPPIVSSGSIVGRLLGPLSELPALRDTRLIAPACHDTASAIAGIPAQGDDWAYISSGTWSLMGARLAEPCATPEAARLGFTNEGGVGGSVCFLRNIQGLWLLSQCEAAWQANGEAWTTEMLVRAAEALPAPAHWLDVDDPEFLSPGEMPQKILCQMERKAGRLAISGLDAPAAMTNLILHSLAARYAACLRDAARLTGREFRRLFIVGGGSQNQYLNRLTQAATGMELHLGSAESSTIGNFAVQLAALETNSAEGSVDFRTGAERDAITRWTQKLFHAVQSSSKTEAFWGAGSST